MRWTKIKRGEKPKGAFWALIATRDELGYAALDSFAYWDSKCWFDYSLRREGIRKAETKTRWVYAYIKAPPCPWFMGKK